MEQRYRRTKDQKLWSGLPKLKVKMSKLGDVCEQTRVTQRYHERGSGGGAPAAGGFVGLGASPPEGKTSDFFGNDFLEKWAIFWKNKLF